MNCSDKWVVQLIIDQCIAHGIHHVIFSPGSRNAPLAISADEHLDLITTVIHDERSAAFYALGLSEQLNEPVALCCTSGSAAANYLPAITEAYYRNLPIIVITADRPESWIDQGDGQTIRQKGIYQDYVKYSCHLEDSTIDANKLWAYQRETAILFAECTAYPKAPVHINVGLKEPLYEVEEKSRNFARIIHKMSLEHCGESQFKEWFDDSSGKKIMVLCGQNTPNRELEQQLVQFNQQENVLVLVENTSNFSDQSFIHCIDRVLNGIDDESPFYPDLLITLGGAVVSKKIKDFLRRAPLTNHIQISSGLRYMDTYQKLTHTLNVNPTWFFKQWNRNSNSKIESNFKKNWKLIDSQAQKNMHTFEVEADVFTDFQVYQEFHKQSFSPAVIHMANSSVVRYFQLFDPIPGVEYHANRGTSGIDGSMSTAMGFASVDQRKQIFVTGDISFLYDSNALYLTSHVKNLKVILINNQGGGIFRIIPGSKDSKQLETYFEGKHEFNGSMVEKIGWTYIKIDSLDQLKSEWQKFLIFDGPLVMECRTNESINADILTQYFNHIK